ncbi:MAG: hypothetical protein WD021_06825 [Rhodothermales bacterium]
MTCIRPYAVVLCALLLASALVGPSPVSAQDDPNDTQQGQVLPDIAPRVVEIRGNLELSLPTLQRQPLIGFNPPPRVAAVPPDRRPYVEDYKQESIDLPPSPLRPPDPPPAASLIGGTPLNGSLKAAGGLYLSRSLDFRSEWGVTDRAAIYSRLDYEGSLGHDAAGSFEEDVTASYDALDALVGVQNTTRWATVGFEIDGFLNAYRLFGAFPAADYPALRDDPPFRDGRGGGALLRVTTQAATGVDLDLSVRYGVAQYETDALSGVVGTGASVDPDAFLREEASLELESHLGVPLSERSDVLGDVHFTGLGFGETIGSDVVMLDGAGGARLRVENRVEITGLARLMSFSQGDTSSAFFASPDLLVNIYPTRGFRLYAQNAPRAEHRSTASMYRLNPYLVDGPLVQPTIYTVDARAGARVQMGLFEADAHLGYSRAPHFRYFERATNAESGGYRHGMIAARYDGAAISYVGGDVSVSLPAGFHVSGGLTVRDGALTDDDRDIPYFAPMIARGGLSWSVGRAFIQATTIFESARDVDAAGSRRLGDFFDLDVDASYRLTDRLGALLRFQNLSSGYLERWEHHERSPFIISAGIQARW